MLLDHKASGIKIGAEGPTVCYVLPVNTSFEVTAFIATQTDFTSVGFVWLKPRSTQLHWQAVWKERVLVGRRLFTVLKKYLRAGGI
jgi:hypothetical protein